MSALCATTILISSPPHTLHTSSLSSLGPTTFIPPSANSSSSAALPSETNAASSHHHSSSVSSTPSNPKTSNKIKIKHMYPHPTLPLIASVSTCNLIQVHSYGGSAGSGMLFCYHVSSGDVSSGDVFTDLSSGTQYSCSPSSTNPSISPTAVSHNADLLTSSNPSLQRSGPPSICHLTWYDDHSIHTADHKFASPTIETKMTTVKPAILVTTQSTLYKILLPDEPCQIGTSEGGVANGGVSSGGGSPFSSRSLSPVTPLLSSLSGTMESSLPLCSQVLRDGVIGVGCSDGCLRVFDMVNMVVVKVIKARARARARGRDGHGGGTTTGGGMQGGGMQGGGMQGGGMQGGGGVVEGMVSLVLNNISRSSGIVVSPQLPLSAKLNFSLLISPSSHSTPPSASSSTGGTLYLYSLPLQPPAIIDDSGPYAKIEGLRGLNYNEGEGGTKGVPWVVWDGENAAKKEGGGRIFGLVKKSRDGGRNGNGNGNGVFVDGAVGWDAVGVYNVYNDGHYSDKGTTTTIHPQLLISPPHQPSLTTSITYLPLNHTSSHRMASKSNLNFITTRGSNRRGGKNDNIVSFWSSRGRDPEERNLGEIAFSPIREEKATEVQAFDLSIKPQGSAGETDGKEDDIYSSATSRGSGSGGGSGSGSGSGSTSNSSRGQGVDWNCWDFSSGGLHGPEIENEKGNERRFPKIKTYTSCVCSGLYNCGESKFLSGGSVIAFGTSHGVVVESVDSPHGREIFSRDCFGGGHVQGPLKVRPGIAKGKKGKLGGLFYVSPHTGAVQYLPPPPPMNHGGDSSFIRPRLFHCPGFAAATPISDANGGPATKTFISLSPTGSYLAVITSFQRGFPSQTSTTATSAPASKHLIEDAGPISVDIVDVSTGLTVSGGANLTSDCSGGKGESDDVPGEMKDFRWFGYENHFAILHTVDHSTDNKTSNVPFNPSSRSSHSPAAPRKSRLSIFGVGRRSREEAEARELRRKEEESRRLNSNKANARVRIMQVITESRGGDPNATETNATNAEKTEVTKKGRVIGLGYVPRKSFQGRDPTALHGGEGDLLFIGTDAARNDQRGLGGFHCWNRDSHRDQGEDRSTSITGSSFVVSPAGADADADADVADSGFGELKHFVAVGGGGRSLPLPDFLCWEKGGARLLFSVGSRGYIYECGDNGGGLVGRGSFPMESTTQRRATMWEERKFWWNNGNGKIKCWDEGKVKTSANVQGNFEPLGGNIMWDVERLERVELT